MNAMLALVLAYVVVTSAIGFALTRRSKSAGELFTARNQLTLVTLVVLLFGEIVAASSTAGTAQGGYSQGISAFWVFGGRGLGAIVFAVLLTGFYTQAGKYGAMSIPEAFRFRFDEKTRIVVTIIIFVPLILTCAAQCRACASIVGAMLDVNVDALIVVTGALFGLLALTGLKGIANMNILHAMLLFFGMLGAAVACVVYVGGFDSIVERAPEGYLDIMYPDALKILGDFASSTLAFTIAVTPTNACYSSTDMRMNRAGLIVVGLLTAVYALFPVAIGICGSIVLPGIDPNTVVYQMPALVSPVWSTVVSMAILAAVMSSAPFLYLQAATILTRDIAGLARRNASQESQLKTAYAFILVVTCVVVFLALNSSTVFAQIIGAAHIKATAAIVLVAGMFWKRLTNNAAFWAILISGVLSMVFFFSGSVFGAAIEPFWPTSAIGIALMVLVTAFDRRHQSTDWESYRTRWREAESRYQGSADEASS